MNVHRTKSEEIARLARILREEGWEVSSITIVTPGCVEVRTGAALKLKASLVDTASSKH